MYSDAYGGSEAVKTYLYDAAGQLTNWVVSTTNGWSQSRALRYDAGGRILTQAVDAVVSTNVYDKTDQLLSRSGSYSYSATYDAVGNRQTADGWTYGVNALDQYTYRTRSGSTQNLSYDDNGNVSSFNGVRLEHDSQPAYCTDADVFAQEAPQDKWSGKSICQRPTTQNALSGRTPTIGMRCQLSALRVHVACGLVQHAG